MPQYIKHTGDTDTYFGFPSNDTFTVYTAAGEGLNIDSNRNVTFTGNILGSATDFKIGVNTSDGSDNAQLKIMGGGDATDTRGASIHLAGNEHGNAGLLQIRAGDGATGGIRFYEGGSERMRITAGKVGIGTGTPAYKLDVNGGSIFMDTDWPFYLGSTNAFIEGNSTGTIIRSNATAGFKWTDGGTTHMILDTNGNLGIGTASPVNNANWAGLTLSGTTGGQIDFQDDGTTVGAIYNGTWGLALTAVSGKELRLYSGNTLALTLDSSQDATFEGDVTIGALTSGETAQLVVNHEGGASPVAAFMSRTNRAKIKIGDNDTNGYLVSENGIYGIGRTDSVSANNINIDASHNVGIRTITPAANLDVQGGIIAGGKTMYTIAPGASLTTTGTAVAGLSTGTNLQSSGFTFTCFGGDGYQRIVYSCRNESGTWNIDKDIDEGVNAFDVTYAADGSDNITFTFKSRSGTQSYAPRVTVEAIGDQIQTSYIN